MGAARNTGRVTDLSVPLADRIVLFGGFPLAGAGLGALVPVLARWALGWGIGLPFGFLFRLAGSVGSAWEIAACMAAVAIAGLVLGVIGWSELAGFRVSDDQLDVARAGQDRTITRPDISLIVADKGQCVVLDRGSQVAIREKPAVRMAQLRAALIDHGYPWSDGD